MRKVRLERMTVAEAEAAFATNPVVLIPLGSTEQHGPQSPVGDFRIAMRLAEELALRTGSIVAPVIPFSEGAHARDFPGAVPIQPETLASLVRDVCHAFFRFKLDHVLLVCGDHGDVPILERLVRRIKDECGIRVGMVEQFRWFTPPLLKQVYGEEAPPLGHGGDPVFSLNLYLFPEDVRSDLVEDPLRRTLWGLPNSGYSALRYEDQLIYLPLDYREVSPNGVLGDPAIASRVRGEQLFHALVEIGVDIVRRFREIETRIAPLQAGASRDRGCVTNQGERGPLAKAEET